MIDLYHASYEIIEHPDVHYGRKNADFGQGFYTTDSLDFARKWVRESPGKDIIISRYSLDESSLKIKRFERNTEWFNYIFSNRRVKPDAYAEYDLIMGPVANDTIYETFGIITSGYLSDEEAMKLLLIGPMSQQIVLKSMKATDNLKFISHEVLSKELIREASRQHAKDGEIYQSEFAKVMESLETTENK
ncbi:DUF3990 domain-containing protein [Butyrivibrio sp. VCB2006]|uniref:DUF3990 domain-containing protein n=1 Tax=Butyrivibrio sp. VCB2006 TaxID=1280679 RepID=UPI000429D05D|nr:DUF3990 domain-containing protein [Butyrivibrio sp. VCB2006]